MTRFFVVSFLFVFSISFNPSDACNGYKMRFISVDNCSGDDQVIKVDSNFTTELSKDCILTTNGCVTSLGFEQAKVKFSIKKDGMELMKEQTDICSMLKKPTVDDIKAKLKIFGFPTQCPVPAGRKCNDGSEKLDISKFKNLLPMAKGKIIAHFDTTHDTGKSCVQANLEVYK